MTRHALPSHGEAGTNAGGFWTTALTFLGAAVTLKETDKTGWRVCLGFMGFFLLAAALATGLAYRYKIRKARRVERTRRQRGDPSRDPVDMA